MARGVNTTGWAAVCSGPAGPVPRFFRYASVGALATLVHGALLAGLVEYAGWAAWVASGAGAIAGAQVAFVGNRVVTFVATPSVGWRASWLRFQLTAAAGALVGMVIVSVGVHAGVHYLIAQAVATAAVLIGTYAVNARWTFVGRRPGS